MSSTPTKTPAKSSEPIFTPRELELLGKAMQCNKNDVQIDYVKFAELGGFKNANSSKASWHGIKKKFERASGNAIDGGGSNAGAATGEGDAKGDVDAPPKKTPASRKRKAAATNDDGEEATPTKSAKKPCKPKAKSAADVTASDEDEEKNDVKKEPDSDEGAEKGDAADGEAVKKEEDDEA